MKEKLSRIYEDYLKFPIYILFHPFDGYDEFKRNKRGKFSVAIVLILLFTLLRILQIQYNGFLINDTNPKDLNSLKEIFATFLVIGLFVVGNWSVTTLMEGKGNMKEILMVTGYSLLPIILIGYPSILLSHLITMEEVGIYNLIVGLGIIATGWMLFMGMLNVHEYGLFKTIGAFIATLVSMLVMIFVGLLFFDLIQQFVTFVKMIWQEINLRY